MIRSGSPPSPGPALHWLSTCLRDGGSVGRIRWDRQTIALLVNHAYLVFAAGAPKDRYVDLLNPVNAPTPIVVTDAGAFVIHLGTIKEIVGEYSNEERQGVNGIAARLPEVIDIEAAFNTDAESSEPEFENEDLRRGGRIDLVTVAEDGRIVFTEAKLFKNRQLRANPPDQVPAVCSQLSLYHGWLRDHADEIQNAYTNLRAYYQALNGAFFKRRSKQVNRELSVDPIPRLLVLDCDDPQGQAAQQIRGSVYRGVADTIPGFGMDHIRIVVSAQKVKPADLM